MVIDKSHLPHDAIFSNKNSALAVKGFSKYIRNDILDRHTPGACPERSRKESFAIV